MKNNKGKDDCRFHIGGSISEIAVKQRLLKKKERKREREKASYLLT